MQINVFQLNWTNQRSSLWQGIFVWLSKTQQRLRVFLDSVCWTTSSRYRLSSSSLIYQQEVRKIEKERETKRGRENYKHWYQVLNWIFGLHNHVKQFQKWFLYHMSTSSVCLSPLVYYRSFICLCIYQISLYEFTIYHLPIYVSCWYYFPKESWLIKHSIQLKWPLLNLVGIEVNLSE